jgi:molybdate transport system permease protein
MRNRIKEPGVSNSPVTDNEHMMTRPPRLGQGRVARYGGQAADAPALPARRHSSRLWLAALGLYLFAALPLVALLLRVSPSQVIGHLTETAALQALAISLVTSTAATALCVLFGLPAAYLLARHRFPGREWLDTLTDLPLTLPPVVAGVGLLMAFGRMGLVGRHLEAMGIQVAFTTLAVVLAQAFVALPFFVKAARAGFAAVEPDMEQTALTLGADRWQAFRYVTLPLARPALLAGITLTWARAMSEFGATLMFAGNLPGRTQTLPLAVMSAMESDTDLALSLSALTLLIAGGALVAAKLLLRGEVEPA